MATPPTSSNVKVTLRATPVGARVIRRLELPNIDKSAELRRLVELGFAAELAGFTLDGTVLRFGGRVWDMRSEHVQAEVRSPVPDALAQGTDATSGSGPAVTAESSSPTGDALPGSDTPGSSGVSGSTESASQGQSVLLSNLRGLAGGQ